MPTLVRDRLTWLTYGQLATYGFFLYGFGPSVPLLRDDLGVSNAVSGLHGTALATGAVLAGLTFAPLAGRLGRARVLRAGLAGVVAGTVTYCLGPVLPLTLAGAFVCGLFGSYVVTGSIVVLSARHGPAGYAAISEANAGAAGAGLVSPLLLGLGMSVGVGWRPGLLATAVAAAAVWVVSVRAVPAASVAAAGDGGRRAAGAAHPAGPDDAADPAGPVAGTDAAARPAAVVGDGAAGDTVSAEGAAGDPSAGDPSAGARAAGDPSAGARAAGDPSAGARAAGDLPGRLPAAYWLAWTVLVLCIGVEFCLTFWAADSLREHTGAGPTAAAAGVTAVVAGMFAGRLAGGRLALLARPRSLLLGAVAVALAGFAGFWASTSTLPALAGLAGCGLGVALQYPVGAVRAVAASGRRPDRAAARASLAAGLASGVAPFVLGAAADRVGTHTAFLLVPVLLTAAAVCILFSRDPLAEPPSQV